MNLSTISGGERMLISTCQPGKVTGMSHPSSVSVVGLSTSMVVDRLRSLSRMRESSASCDV